MKTVMVFGTFDILHVGHLDFFKQARKLGDYLLVVVARDVNVKKIKQNEAINNEKERLELLQHIDLIDKAIWGDTRDVYKVIRTYKPDVIALGYDQKEFTDTLKDKMKEFKLSTNVVRLKPYHAENKKSGKIKSILLKSL
ncbi:MAG: hypothetical protein A2821_04000 [Candidatus Magasanikbacteria bacterium RIFCSPHIGHO2_01_FULL_41_23]|uniref:Cytidyltransferase-like domain-containing protein n=1 Tax=Candidatus Magasanikbacteria bacterium RIFCSPLOWO2_01_FULL_40_15 TaxID=1798686 RepID=A0A1F6N311_9BACT|nr:MAG: hypothetical protein A2821_04000 [Candidatus Magasanikbacteria bacterium RIFCSPHIGHO2_01_FULL_41_23]OGH66979.1 MAG: hypothetical protein A3C66_00540 [Candidatus Magasanikbacteria bacterium RIFCSPHIGHO2_02_FULL_41_35]OGH74960.1 MAG: hypothetical protein A3F22_02675 [Candidatus Magasanikbacteria bacterium RIFCSPHIGHO2_12_FULL_41_16]OGH78262.1 MAG: hypothetical protein A2983_02310 [Candidatus Magasanikbacteria bacterium RIFCSPLOWO2_01_FULL_40_15]